MTELTETIMNLGCTQGIFSMAFLERSLKAIDISVKAIDISNAVQHLIDEEKLLKIESDSGQEILCASMSGEWLASDSRLGMNQSVASDVRCALERGASNSDCTEAFNKLSASTIDQNRLVARRNDDDAKSLKCLINSKNLTNVHLRDTMFSF